MEDRQRQKAPHPVLVAVDGAFERPETPVELRGHALRGLAGAEDERSKRRGDEQCAEVEAAEPLAREERGRGGRQRGSQPEGNVGSVVGRTLRQLEAEECSFNAVIRHRIRREGEGRLGETWYPGSPADEHCSGVRVDAVDPGAMGGDVVEGVLPAGAMDPENDDGQRCEEACEGGGESEATEHFGEKKC